VRDVVHTVHLSRIVLSRSAARGQVSPDSDLDLLIMMPEGTHRGHTAQHLYRTSGGLGVPFELVVATPSDLDRHRDNPGLIYRTILEEGRTGCAA